MTREEAIYEALVELSVYTGICQSYIRNGTGTVIEAKQAAIKMQKNEEFMKKIIDGLEVYITDILRRDKASGN